MNVYLFPQIEISETLLQSRNETYPTWKKFFFFHLLLPYAEAMTMFCMISDILMGIFETLKIAHRHMLLSLLKSEDLELQLEYY